MKPLFFGLLAVSLWLSQSAPRTASAQAVGDTFYVHGETMAPLRGTLQAENKGFLIEPAQCVAGGGVREIVATASGSHVIVLRETYRPTPEAIVRNANQSPNPLAGEASVTVWNATTRKAAVVWRQRIEPEDTFGLQTTGVLHGPQGDRILAWVTTQKPLNKSTNQITSQTTLLIDAERGVVRSVNLPLTEYGFTNPSPSAPFAALVGPDGATDERLRFLRANGTLTDAISLTSPVFWMGWVKSGTVLRGVQSGDGDKWYEANPQTGTLTPIPTPPKNEQESVRRRNPPATLPQLSLVSRSALPGSPTRTGSVWLQVTGEAKKDGETKADAGEAVLLSMEATPVFLLPRAALFLTPDGSLFAAPIQSVSQSALLAVRRKQTREADLRDIQDVGRALFRYVFKNDDEFPAGGTDLTQLLGPYLKNLSALRDFIYQPPASLKIIDLKNAKADPIGYRPGDGGRTVLYGDGHAAWQETP